MSTMDTDELIARLARDTVPVRRLPSPARRAVLWFAIALPAVALIVLAMSPRPDFAERLQDGRYLLEQAAALATAVLAAVAAFSAGVPGRSKWILWLPLVPLAVWLGSLGQGCWQTWLRIDTEGIHFSPDWICIPAIAITGAVPGAAMVAMIRRGAPLMPRLTMALGALAAGALADVGLRLFHPQDASLMVLVWQFGTVALLTALASTAGRLLVLRWP
jgi:hypothetical protein